MMIIKISRCFSEYKALYSAIEIRTVFRMLKNREEKHVKALNDTFRLNNGYEIPCVGFATWQMPDFIRTGSNSDNQ